MGQGRHQIYAISETRLGTYISRGPVFVTGQFVYNIRTLPDLEYLHEPGRLREELSPQLFPRAIKNATMKK
jgi:hypothetical protein